METTIEQVINEVLDQYDWKSFTQIGDGRPEYNGVGVHCVGFTLNDGREVDLEVDADASFEDLQDGLEYYEV